MSYINVKRTKFLKKEWPVKSYSRGKSRDVIPVKSREQTIETIYHFFFFYCSFAISFWKEVYEQILNKLKSCKSLTPEYHDIILGFSEEKMDLLNYILILGKSYLWTCRCKEIKPCLSLFERILINKYQTDKYISLKLNNLNLFKKKWKMLEEINFVQ